MPSSSFLVPITDAADLAAWIARSHRAPILIFKHSLTCGTSAFAREELEHFLAHASDAPPCGLVVVQTHREVSADVARLTGVAHHSPQVLLVIDGAVRWQASHWRITAQALAAALLGLETSRVSP